ncbi:MAG: tetratricopeptide repeat protein [Thermomicrobiales bacterium]|nr:tetratricopeptide repeat protein [Thermomicrobiales bacterium]
MESILRPKGRYQLIFVIMAVLMICSLLAGVVGTVVLDAFEDDGGGGNTIEVDASVEDAFRATAEANPDDPGAAIAYANYLANMGNLTEAIPWYERALGVAPENAVYRLDFARSLAGGGMHGDAEFQFERAIELNPADPQAHFYLGELYYSMDPRRTIDAIDQYEQTISLDSESFVAQRAQERLVELGAATPEASPSPVAG